MSKKFIGAIIGPSGIGKAHLRELINFGFKNIAVVGKKFKKNRIVDLKKKHKDITFYNLKSIKEIKKIKPRFINVCSPTKYHYEHIHEIKNFCKNLIIEKPIFWIRNKKKSNLELTKKLFNFKRNKIFVNLPMISLANQIKKKNKDLKIRRLNFNYFTRGKNEFENIPIDLLPHALSFLFTLNSNNLVSFKIIRVIKKKKIWKCYISINNCLCKFHFKQDFRRNDSLLSFKINDDFYLRKQVIKGDVYHNKLLKNKKKIVNIKNPLTDYLRSIFKNFNKKYMLKKNNDITLSSIKIMDKLVNY
tara:strand:- start:791 stop:1699 length:909 start_codon:yes stop_codon:yes gene_type:complete